MAKYSVPAHLIGRNVRVSLRASVVVVFDGHQEVARHERVVARGGQSVVLDHYLEVLRQKPGALPGATALARAREAGVFTAAHDAFWAAARKTDGDAVGTRALIDVLLLHRSMPAEEVIAGIHAALQVGAVTADVVAVEARRQTSTGGPGLHGHLRELASGREQRVVSLTQRRLADPAAVIAGLPADTRPLPSVAGYDELLERRARRRLRLPTVRAVVDEALVTANREQLSYQGFLAELLLAECDDRDRRSSIRRVSAAGFPRSKWLGDFDFDANPNINPTTIHQLATGDWIRKGEPLCLIGDSGTGKSHLLIGLGTAAAEKGYRVKYTLATKLVNELVEAADEKQLARTIARYGRVDLLCIDELGYMELDRRGAELLFQVLTEREEKNSVAIASNESFSGWTRTFTDPRLCAAIVDRLTFGGSIIETGTDSYRLAHTRRLTDQV